MGACITRNDATCRCRDSFRSPKATEPWNIVDLSEKNLARIPENILTSSQHVISLNISRNFGIQLAGDIGKFVNLTILAADHCGIQSLPEEIRQLRKLQELHLKGNMLTDLPDWLTKLKKLQKLKICNSSLSALSDAMAKMTTLLELDLSLNELKELPKCLTKLTQLTILNLNRCHLSSLPDEMAKMTALQKLSLSCNELSVLPMCLTELTQLTVLDLSSCGLSSLPDEMAKMTALVELDLNANELKEFPKCLTKLTQLTILKLSGCKESFSFPDDVAKMTSLRDLDLSFIKQLDFPECLTELAQLTKLTLYGGRLSRLPETIAKMTALTEIDLTGNIGIVLPVGLTKLTQLTILKLGGCRLSSLPVSMANMTSLQELDLDVNYLGVIPECLTDLSQLTELTLRACGLSSLPGAMRKMTSLRNLDLSENNLKDLPKCLKELTQLLELDLHENNLRKLPECLTELVQLTKLILRRCGLSSLPKAMEKMTALRELDLSANQELREFPDCLTKLAQLTKLTLIWCGLSSLPVELEKMTALQRLDVTGNKLSSLPDAIGSLVQLDTLRCKGNMLVAYPEAVLNLKMLRELDFSYQGQLDTLTRNCNWFNGYPEALFGPDLPFDYYRSRQAKDNSTERFHKIPDGFIDSHPQLKRLNLEGNAMISPPKEICAQGVDAIRRYLTAIRLGGDKYSPYSICTLGETGVGKSSIVLSLKTGQPSTTSEANRTHVMDQETVVLNETAITVNDFGGHDIYQMVLPMFLPFQRLGILVYKTCEEWTKQEEQVRKWIATVIATSPGMHLIVVGTHADELDKSKHEDFQKKMENLVEEQYNKAKEDLKGHIAKIREYERDLREPERDPCCQQLQISLESLPPSKKPVIITSCLKNGYTSDLMELKTLILKHVEHAVQMPTKWLHFIREVLEFKGSSLCMRMEQAQEMCKQCLGDDYTMSLKDDILKYLVGTSKIIWLADHPKLKDFIFHRFDGILDACKEILHHEHVLSKPYERDECLYKQGFLTHSLTLKLLEKYSDEEKSAFSELMLKFSLVVKSKAKSQAGDETMLIPCRLPDEDSLLKQPLPTVKIQIKFLTEVIPLVFFENSLAYLVVHLENRSIEPQFWKNRVVYGVNGIVLWYEKNLVSNLVYVTASVDPSVDLKHIEHLWEELSNLLEIICRHIRESWLGTWPTFTFQCPISIRKHGVKFHGRQAALNVLMKPCEYPQHFCKECKEHVLSFFMYYCKTGTLSQSDFEDVKRFLKETSDAAVKTDASSIVKAPATNAAQFRDGGSTCTATPLTDRLRNNFSKFVRGLTEQGVGDIARSLFSSGDITSAEMEYIRADGETPTEKANRLVSTCLKKNELCIRAFKQILETLDKSSNELARLLEG